MAISIQLHYVDNVVFVYLDLGTESKRLKRERREMESIREGGRGRYAGGMLTDAASADHGVVIGHVTLSSTIKQLRDQLFYCKLFSLCALHAG